MTGKECRRVARRAGAVVKIKIDNTMSRAFEGV